MCPWLRTCRSNGAWQISNGVFYRHAAPPALTLEFFNSLLAHSLCHTNVTVEALTPQWCVGQVSNESSCYIA